MLSHEIRRPTNDGMRPRHSVEDVERVMIGGMIQEVELDATGNGLLALGDLSIELESVRRVMGRALSAQ